MPISCIFYEKFKFTVIVVIDWKEGRGGEMFYVSCDGKCFAKKRELSGGIDDTLIIQNNKQYSYLQNATRISQQTKMVSTYITVCEKKKKKYDVVPTGADKYLQTQKWISKNNVAKKTNKRSTNQCWSPEQARYLQ